MALDVTGVFSFVPAAHWATLRGIETHSRIAFGFFFSELKLVVSLNTRKIQSIHDDSPAGCAHTHQRGGPLTMNILLKAIHMPVRRLPPSALKRSPGRRTTSTMKRSPRIRCIGCGGPECRHIEGNRYILPPIAICTGASWAAVSAYTMARQYGEVSPSVGGRGGPCHGKNGNKDSFAGLFRNPWFPMPIAGCQFLWPGLNCS